MDKKPISRYLLLVFLGCWLGGVFDGMDSTLMTVVMPVAIKELVRSSDKAVVSQAGAIVTAVFLLGWTLGGIFFGLLGDKIGRVKSMIISIILYALFTGLAGLSQDTYQLAICRFLTGLGIGGELVSITTYLAEVWPERSRAIAIGVLLTSYQAGVFVAGLITYVVADWRIVFFIGAAPAILALFLRFSLKESDSWLHSKQEEKEKTSELTLLKQLFSKEYRYDAIRGALIFCGLLIGYWASLSWIPTWIQSLFPASYTATSERSIATMMQGVFAVLGCASAGFFAERIGRRYSILFGFLGCFFASMLLFMTNSTFSPIVYAECALLGYFIGLGQAIVYIYLPELFPTSIRATGTGFGLNAGRITTVFAVFMLPYTVSFFGSYSTAAFIFALSYLLSASVSFFAKETKGKPLPL